jgi:hypothetical protein
MFILYLSGLLESLRPNYLVEEDNNADNDDNNDGWTFLFFLLFIRD